MKSFSNLNVAIEYAFIDNDLFVLAIDNRSNEILQQYLIDEFFPESNANLTYLSRNQENLLKKIEVKILHEPPA